MQLAADFSPRYERVHDDVVLIDVSGLGRVIGPPAEVARELARAAEARGVRLAIAIASTRTAATLLALHGAAGAASTTLGTGASAGLTASSGSTDPRARAASASAPESRASTGTSHVATTASAAAAATRAVRTGERTATRAGSAARVSSRAPSSASAVSPLGHTHVIVVPPGDEAQALAPLPVALLARLPDGGVGHDRGAHGSVMHGSVAHGSAMQGSAVHGGGVHGGAGAGDVRDAAAAVGVRGRGRGRGGSRIGDQASAAYGQTRGKRSRGSGRNYRLAPAPGESQAEAIALLDTLRRWGIHTLGELLRLPGADLFERFGPASFWLRQVACGIDARPLVPTLVEEAFEATLALEWPIENLEPLAFVLGRVVDPLCARLEQRDRGAVVVHVALRLVTKIVETRRIELPAPMRDAKVLRTLVLLDLESHPPDAGIDSVTIRFDVTPGRIVQHSLLTRALPSPEQLSTLIARLTAVMGEGRVGAPALIDSHRPEAFALRRFNPPVMADPSASGHAAGAKGAGGRGGSGRRGNRRSSEQGGNSEHRADRLGGSNSVSRGTGQDDGTAAGTLALLEVMRDADHRCVRADGTAAAAAEDVAAAIARTERNSGSQGQSAGGVDGTDRVDRADRVADADADAGAMMSAPGALPADTSSPDVAQTESAQKDVAQRDSAQAGMAPADMPPVRVATSLRRFRRPLPIDVRMQAGRPVHLSAARGVRGGRIVEAAGPWRSSGQWWQPSPGDMARTLESMAGMATARPEPPAAAATVGAAPAPDAAAPLPDAPITASMAASKVLTKPLPGSAEAGAIERRSAAARPHAGPRKARAETAADDAAHTGATRADAGAAGRAGDPARPRASGKTAARDSAAARSRATTHGSAATGDHVVPGARADVRGPEQANAGVDPAPAPDAQPAAFTRAWVRDEWDIVLSGGELCRIYYDGVRKRWMLASIID